MIVKAVMPNRFSIMAFGIAQVLIDLEVLWNMAHNNNQLHTFFHTYLGASFIVLIAAPLGKRVSGWARKIWNLAAGNFSPFDMTVSGHTSWMATLLGASIGAYSHVLFDSFYHSDIKPFQPWSDSNPCEGLIAPFRMEIVFNALFIIGLAGFIMGEIWRKRAQRRQPSPDADLPLTRAEREEVAAQIDAFLSGSCGSYDWDDLISIPQTKKAYELVRGYLSSTSEIYPTQKGWCSPAGIKQLQLFAQLLRSSATHSEIDAFIVSEEQKRG